jgi:uncharacterized protein (DUF1778 family)
MTLTLEITPDEEKALAQAAEQAGVAAPDYALALLREALEDAAAIAEADRIIVNSDPTKRRTLSELRSAIAEQRKVFQRSFDAVT